MKCNETQDKNATFPVVAVVLSPIVMVILLILTVIIMNKLLGKKRFGRAQQILLLSLIMIVAFLLISWQIFKQFMNPLCNFDDQFNGLGGMSAMSLVVGMGGNIIFGFIDNAGLFFGSNQLEELFQILPGGSDANVCAGYGNTYSDLLGTFLGTFVSIILQRSTGIGETPLWANAIGIVIGCLLGILVPKLILRNSRTGGLNKIRASTILLGNMDTDELKEIVHGNMSLFDYRSLKAFRMLDTNNSDSLDYDEIKVYFKTAMGSDFIEKDFYNVMKVNFDIAQEDDNKSEWTISEFRTVQKNLANQMYEEKLLEIPKSDKIASDNTDKNDNKDKND